MREKSVKKRVMAFGVSIFVLGNFFSANIWTVCAEKKNFQYEINSNEEGGEYEILETDTKGRLIMERVGNVYCTTEYYDEQKKVIEYQSEGLFDGSNYDEKIETIEYDKNQFGSVKTVTTTNLEGKEICEYDENENITRKVDKDGIVSLITYNNGYVSTETNPYTGTDADKRYTNYYEYSDEGELLLEKVPVQVDDAGKILYSIEKYEYDKNSNVICKMKLANANEEQPQYTVTKNEYDNNSNLIKVEEFDVKGQVQSIAQYYYDENNYKVRQYSGLTDSLTINGLDDIIVGNDKEYSVIQYEYDSDGNLLKEIDSHNNSITYGYDSYGNISNKTDKNGNRFEYTYREGIYLAEEKVYYPENKGENPDVLKTYEQEVLEDGSFGQLMKISEGDSAITRTYTKEGEIESEIDQNGNKTAYKYDDKGKILENAIYAKDGELIDSSKYVYNEQGQLINIKDSKSNLVCSYEYDDRGQMICENFGNGAYSDYEYSDWGELKTIASYDKDNEVIYNHKYEYTLDNKLVDDYDVLTCTGERYRYDSTGGLCQEVAYSDSGAFEEKAAYAFDESGNRISLKNDTELIKTTFDESNHIRTVNEEEVKYDNNGNLIQMGNTKYYYDYDNRLIKFESESDVVEYKYDVYGNMIQRIINGENENLVWANEKVVARISDETTFFHRGLGDKVKAISDEEDMYVHSNRRGDIIATSNRTGEVFETYQYESFGSSSLHMSKDLRLGYTGELYDPISDLIYLSARFYNPSTGNFLTEDSLDGFEDELLSLNRYTYCTNDPVNYTDPTGHWPNSLHKTFTQSATSDGLVIKSATEWADQYLHASEKKIKVKLDSKSKARYKKLASKCRNVEQDGYKYKSLFHGRGDYDQYLAYIMSVSLQLKAGYLTDELTLKYGNGKEVFEQINFDLLITLPSLLDKYTNYGASRKSFSLIILGLGIHMVEDLWAHIATVRVMNDTDAFVKKDFPTGNYDLVEKARKTECGISYLHLSEVRDKSICDLHTKYAEGKGFENSKYLNMRKNHSINAAKKLVELYSGNITKSNSKSIFTGAGGAIMKKNITVTVGKVTKTFKTGRYKCNGGKEQDICKALYNPTKYSTLNYKPYATLK